MNLLYNRVNYQNEGIEIMKIYKVTNLKKSVGDKILFNNLEFSISEGDRIGLIGINGTGKSTLLNIISDIDHPDSALVDKPNDYAISYLEQQIELSDYENVIQFVFRNDAPIFKLVREYEDVLEMLKNDSSNEKTLNLLFELQTKMDSQGGWDLHSKTMTILDRLGIKDVHAPIQSLSGGQKKRASLAKVLIEEPDLLILDEPTNHLDYQTIQWLKNYLNGFSKALLFVTHDRYFLDGCSTKIWELANQTVKEYKGNYESYLEIKAIQDEVEEKSAHKLKQLFNAELAWMRKGAKARTTKQKARIERFESIQKDYQSIETTEQLSIETTSSRLGKKVIEAKSISKRYGTKQCIKDFSFILQKGDRIGIVGENGVGKTTLLNILAGTLEPDSGELDFGTTIQIGYFSQELFDLPEDKRMLQYLQESAEEVTIKDGTRITAAQMLEKFLFPSHTHGTIIRKLSGGERRRLFLLKVLIQSPNILLLDEPTNDLDIQTLSILEDYLESFPGVVLTVSHDRYFLDRTMSKLWSFDKNGVISTYFGKVTDFLEWQSAQVQEKERKETVPTPPKREPKPKKRHTYLEAKEWETIEQDLADAERCLEDVQDRLQKIGSDFMLANELLAEEKTLNERIEFLIERWSYLSEKLED